MLETPARKVFDLFLYAGASRFCRGVLHPDKRELLGVYVSDLVVPMLPVSVQLIPEFSPLTGMQIY